MNRTVIPTIAVLLVSAMLPGVAIDAPQVDARIARIEAGLLPPIVWKGKTRVGMPLKERMAHYQVPGVSVAVVECVGRHPAGASGSVGARMRCRRAHFVGQS